MRAKHRNRLRIIGGVWRRRTVVFAPLPGLRPTPDRIRETLFNWLQGYTVRARCLDLFAGSGALGLEALSRGAAHVDFIEPAHRAATLLRTNLTQLGATGAHVWETRAQDFLQQHGQNRYDIVFLDPPYDRQPLLQDVITTLDRLGCITPHGWIYLEHRIHAPLPALPSAWQRHRRCTAGEVCAELYRFEP